MVGAGFIGCEVAASLRSLGVDVALVEPQPVPLTSVSVRRSASLVARLHRSEGVDVRCGVGVADVRGTEKVEEVEFSDGAELDADIIVVGIGSRPARAGWRGAASRSTTAWSVMRSAGPAHRTCGRSAT